MVIRCLILTFRDFNARYVIKCRVFALCCFILCIIFTAFACYGNYTHFNNCIYIIGFSKNFLFEEILVAFLKKSFSYIQAISQGMLLTFIFKEFESVWVINMFQIRF